jgi:hypothetical protein
LVALRTLRAVPIGRRREPKPIKTIRPRNTPEPPKENAWELAETLIPVMSSRQPLLVSDGAGLPFAPEALYRDAVGLDPRDPAAEVVAKQAKSSGGWRLLERSETEAVFSRGTPPMFLTVVVRKEGRRGHWSVLGVFREPHLRAVCEGIRASSWRVDPNYPPGPEDTEISLLVTEQTFATGKFAHGRLLAPEVYIGESEVVIRCYVRPLSGWQNRNVMNRETPVTVVLPEPLGDRELVDGAVYEPAPTPSV